MFVFCYLSFVISRSELNYTSIEKPSGPVGTRTTLLQKVSAEKGGINPHPR